MLAENRKDANRLRHIVDRAAREKIITKEEVGFIVTLIERFRADIDKKIKQLHVLQGEIAQLKSNEQIIINLIESMIAAAERQLARQATMERIKGMKEEKAKSDEEENEEEEASDNGDEEVEEE
jgi:hypothetical protein